MNDKARYANHAHYIKEGWNTAPKEIFKVLGTHLTPRVSGQGLDILDVGCATGELLGYLGGILDEPTLTGVDVAPELLETGRQLLPNASFVQASATALPAEFTDRFDVTTAVGCMSIFDETEIDAFWDNMFRVTRKGGVIVVLSPLNEFGVDTMIRHRKRKDGAPVGWETGWNIFSQDTIRELVEARGGAIDFERFEISFEIEPKVDPVRTWTMQTDTRARQLTNGLKLLVDHYYMIVTK